MNAYFIVGARTKNPAPVPSTKHACIYCSASMWVSNTLTPALMAGSPTVCFECFAERADPSEKIEVLPATRAEVESVLGYDIGSQREITDDIMRAIAKLRRRH